MKDRKTLLEEMLRFENPRELESILSALAEYGWDSDEKLVSLTREHVSSILRRYLAEELSAHDVEEWANAFEVREDVTLGEHGGEEDISDAIYILANPALEGELTHEKAQELGARLKSG